MKSILTLPFLLMTYLCSSQVIINEIMSSNTTSSVDNYGEHEDWIELYNPNDFSVEIAGLVLKDNVDVWTIPSGDNSTLIEPKGYFLLWADDEEPQGKFHTNFKLSAANGEFLGLFKADGTTVIESLTFPPLSDDQSYGKCSDGKWTIFNKATPLKVNDCVNSLVELLNKDQRIVYPTITQGEINIVLPDIFENHADLQVFSAEGKIVLHKTVAAGISKIDLSALPYNVYFLRISSGNYYLREKIVVL